MSTSTTAPRRRRARRGQGELLRDEIMEAADRLLVATGNADAVSIRAVAEAVGVTPPSIYLHFADKTELLYEVCQRRFQQLAQYTDDAVGDAQDVVERLRRRGHAYVGFALQQPEAYRILFMHKPQGVPPTADMMQILGDGGFGDLIADIRRGVDEGLFAGEAPMLHVTMWTAVHGLASLLISQSDFPWPADVETLTTQIIDTMLHGLCRS